MFSQFLADTAEKGQLVNTLSEERLFERVGILHRIAGALSGAGIAYEVIGGMVVLIHVEEANPEHSTLTRDVDLLVNRADLERVKEVAVRAGFSFRHAADVDMLIQAGAENTKNAIHLIFSCEKLRPIYVTTTPTIRPEQKCVQGREVMVVPVADLLAMKLTSFRDQDRVHVRCMDSAGLITTEVGLQLLPVLAERLEFVRSTE